ncbi:MAG: hypothetical protein RRA15_11765 [bacterium]|nr:hypothetical protein [bacterium]
MKEPSDLAVKFSSRAIKGHQKRLHLLAGLKKQTLSLDRLLSSPRLRPAGRTGELDSLRRPFDKLRVAQGRLQPSLKLRLGKHSWPAAKFSSSRTKDQ